MLRLIAAAAISTIILGGLTLFMERRERLSGEGTAVAQTTAATGKFSVDLTLSFTAAAADPFAVAAEVGGRQPVLKVQLNGQQLLSATTAPPAGELIQIADPRGIVVGKNEFLVEADPPLDEANRAHAVRLRVLRDGAPIAEQTVWSEPGARLVARFEVVVPAAVKAAAEGRHD